MVVEICNWIVTEYNYYIFFKFIGMLKFIKTEIDENI